MKNPYCIAIDWLEVSCYGNFINQDSVTFDGKVFYIEREERETPMFKRYYVVKFRGLDFAYIRQEPRLQRMKKGLTCIKLANRVLYQEKFVLHLICLIKALHLRYHGITRLDICYDCNKFYNGRNPHRFIKDYISKPMDEVGGMYLCNCKEYTLHGRKSIGDNGRLNYIAFGSKSKVCRGYIYDKSIELNEVKDKPWIREMWEKNGLKNDEKNHVWRSEISIKCEGKDLLNLETGQLFPLKPEYISTYENVKKIFHYYAAKVFDFRINEGQKNRRHFPPLRLFDTGIDITCLPKRLSNKCDSGRSEKICYNKLKSLSKTYVDMTDSVRHSLWAAMEWIDSLSVIKEARYKAETYKHYLDIFASQRFMSEEDFAYIQACAEVAEKKRELDAEVAYQFYKECSAAFQYQDEY